MHIAICIATCRRPNLLGALLKSLATLSFKKQPVPRLDVVIVDNDPGAPVKHIVDAGRAACPWPIHYSSEPVRGIPSARNRAVRNALALGVDYVAFIDDDEFPDPYWLDELISVRERFDADVVQAPVVPAYGGDVPRWVIRGRFFERSRRLTGQTLELGATNNALIAIRWFTNHERPFDVTFGLSGADDTQFFMRIRRQGARMVWADDAVVWEHVAPERATMRWVLRRALRGGNGFVFAERSVGISGARTCLRFGKALSRILLGATLLPVGALCGREGIVRSLQTMCVGIGALAALAGIRVEEYKVVYGK